MIQSKTQYKKAVKELEVLKNTKNLSDSQVIRKERLEKMVSKYSEISQKNENNPLIINDLPK